MKRLFKNLNKLIIILLLLATCGYAQVRRITSNLPTDTLDGEWLLHVVDGIDDINYKISVENFFKDSLFVNAVDTIMPEAQYWSPNGSDIYYNSGNVGIGTTSPDNELHIFRNSAGSVNSSLPAALTIENDDDVVLQFLTPADKSNKIYFGDPSAAVSGVIEYDHSIDAMSLATNFVFKNIIIDAVGNVGIGMLQPTFTPDSTLQVVGSAHINDHLQVDGLINGVKVYTALITQSGTNAPVATIVGDNTIGSIVWTRNSTGIYYGTLVGAFTLNKTICFNSGADLITRIKRISDNIVEIRTGNFADNQLNDTSIEIRVYP